MLALGAALLFCPFVFGAFALITYAHNLTAGILILLPPVVFAVLLYVIIKDIENAYVDISGDSIRVVDCFFGRKRERLFSFSDITSAQIVLGSSPRVKGYRTSLSGAEYIIFKHEDQYLFKIICLPETKEVFQRYLNDAGVLNEEKNVNSRFEELDRMIERYHSMDSFEEQYDYFLECLSYVVQLEKDAMLVKTKNKRYSISYLKDILDHDGPKNALVIEFFNLYDSTSRYRIGVCVRGTPLLEKVS